MIKTYIRWDYILYTIFCFFIALIGIYTSNLLYLLTGLSCMGTTIILFSRDGLLHKVKIK